MKSLFLGVLLIIILGFGGLVYRNAVEHPSQPIVCPVGSLTCPDGTTVSRTGTSCVYPACPPPNVSLPDAGIAFAMPEGFVAAEVPDAASIAAYEKTADAGISAETIVIRRYAIAASSTALATIQETAIGSPSGLPVSPTSFTSTMLGTRRFTVVTIERFEGVVDTAYYLGRGTDVLRFDAIDRNVNNWTDPGLNTQTLPANTALRKLLSTLQGN
jgi:hypothetical protein